MVSIRSRKWQHLVWFRDRLISSPSARSEYLRLKRTLATEYPRNPRAYADAKAEFIRRLLRDSQTAADLQSRPGTANSGAS
jgi:GrpB-like predicted nucleotidyltransferase (UPF0157 family)